MFDIFWVGALGSDDSKYDSFRRQYPTALRLTSKTTLCQAACEASRRSLTSMYWLVTDDIVLPQDWDFAWCPESWDRQYPHAWPTDRDAVDGWKFRSIYLLPKSFKPTDHELATGWPNQIKFMPGPEIAVRHCDMVILGTEPWHIRAYAALRRRYPWAQYLQHDNIANAVSSCSTTVVSDMYWLISAELDIPSDFYSGWQPEPGRRHTVHSWPTSDHHCVCYLLPRNIKHSDLAVFNVEHVTAPSMSVKPFDIFFISYNESYADENFDQLVQQFPRAQRVHGIQGIHNAHRRCAELCSTEMFYTVDADTVIANGWNFDYVPPHYDRHYLHLWYSSNPVNGLCYGWGSVKLWPTDAVLQFQGHWLDFTTAVGNIKIIPEVIAVSRYNYDAASTWRSAFRESIKLCRNVVLGDHGESWQRLWVWLSAESTAEWSAESRQGAMAGVCYFASVGADNTAALQKINDFEWLEQQFAAATALTAAQCPKHIAHLLGVQLDV